jgi:hypothetical protein
MWSLCTSFVAGWRAGNTLLAWFFVLWFVPFHRGSVSGSPVSVGGHPRGGHWQGSSVRLLWLDGYHLERGGGWRTHNTFLVWFLALWLVPSHRGLVSGSPFRGWRPPTVASGSVPLYGFCGWLGNRLHSPTQGWSSCPWLVVSAIPVEVSRWPPFSGLQSLHTHDPAPPPPPNLRRCMLRNFAPYYWENI